MQAGTVTAVTESPDGTQLGNGFTSSWQLNASGQFVVFESNATNLVSGFKALPDELYLRNLATGVTTPISTDSSGNSLGVDSIVVVATPDDRYVFYAESPNVVPAAGADPLTLPGIFVIDTQEHTTTAVLTGFPGVVVSPGGPESVSLNGELVAFSGGEKGLVAGADASFHPYVRDRQTNQTLFIDAAPATGADDASPGVFAARSGR